jgi:hypothetical protein
VRLRTLLFTLLVAAWTVVAAGAQDVAELSKRIAKEKDRVDITVFAELAAVGSEEALEALEKAIPRLKKVEALGPAYRAFGAFVGAEKELADRARRFLTREIFRAKNRKARPLALEGVLPFGDAALPALERVLRDHSDPVCRGIACDVLVPSLAVRGGLEELNYLLNDATLVGAERTYLGIATSGPGYRSGRTHREVLRTALESFTIPEASVRMADKLHDPATPRAWKLFLIEIFAALRTEESIGVLAGALRDEDSVVVLEALSRIVATEGAEGLADDLRPLFRSREASVRRAAVFALGRLELTDPEAREELFKLAGSSDTAIRMGAAAALVEVRTQRAMELLGELLLDRDWPVRAEAIAQVGRLRDKSFIPILIARLDQENGRLRRDVLGALRVITAIDMGRYSERWQGWWDTAGEEFEVPSAAEVEEAEEARREREEERGRTEAATFYGVEVFSERVCFVLDISGSMRLNAGKNVDPEGPQDPSRPSRMDIAKEELAKIVRAFPDGKLFNLIFFESEIISLSKKLVKMKKSVRQKSLRFIREQYSLGSTALYPALQLAFSDPLVDTIYLISDGAPTEGEITDIVEIRARVRRWNGARHVRIHGITIGQDSDLLRWLTEDTGGTYLRRD